MQPVVTSLLADHRLPLDPEVTSIWKALTRGPDSSLATVVTHYLMDLISDAGGNGHLFEENGTADSRYQKARTGKGPLKARHTGLAAVQALGIMFDTREMAAAATVGFSDIFVPLVMAMSR